MIGNPQQSIMVLTADSEVTLDNEPAAPPQGHCGDMNRRDLLAGVAENTFCVLLQATKPSHTHETILYHKRVSCAECSIRSHYVVLQGVIIMLACA